MSTELIPAQLQLIGCAVWEIRGIDQNSLRAQIINEMSYFAVQTATGAVGGRFKEVGQTASNSCHGNDR